MGKKLRNTQGPMGANDPVIRAMVRSTMDTAQSKNKQSGNKDEHGSDAGGAGEASAFSNQTRIRKILWTKTPPWQAPKYPQQAMLWKADYKVKQVQWKIARPKTGTRL